jgi:Holliday junction resolvase-like predicted endonuclease
MKEPGRRIGELSNRFGELAEHLVAPSIKEKFKTLGYMFDKTTTNIDIADEQDRLSGAEIDILLENTDIAIAVEVKAKPNYRDEDCHLERMDVLRRWADRHTALRVIFVNFFSMQSGVCFLSASLTGALLSMRHGIGLA